MIAGTHGIGIVMLAHAALDRAASVARYWAQAGCSVVIHVDVKVSHAEYNHFVQSLENCDNVLFSKRFRCEWGTWGLVAASQAACEVMLSENPHVDHVILSSGACLPLRPVADLRNYLSRKKGVDIIESVTIADVVWTVGGLDKERFTLRFPFAWKRQRFLFDRYVALQRALGMRRKQPSGISPHIGSQWWCLTAPTLKKILDDPQRKEIDRYFDLCWIPDESYFQTMARRHSNTIESKSLTLSKFDHQGRPHVFYDDHLPLLRKSDCFLARKIWYGADRLYKAFLGGDEQISRKVDPNPGKIDRVFQLAIERRTHGRDGLSMQSRFPSQWSHVKKTPRPYFVFQGFNDLYFNFEPWLKDAGNLIVHGHLFHRKRTEFETREALYHGCLSDNARIRDYNPRAFLGSLLWSAREATQCFQFGPWDRQEIMKFLPYDGNAHLHIITGAWLVPLFKSGLNPKRIRQLAAILQKTERAQIDLLNESYNRAQIQIWSLAEFLESPYDALSIILSSLASQVQINAITPPVMQDLHGFEDSLQMLKNLGMHPHLAGSFPLSSPIGTLRPRSKMPYIIR